MAVFKDKRTIETGIQHGTITILSEDMPLEITTYRVDGDYSDGRHPDSVAFTRSLAEDLRRRDFTVNAMAYHPDAGLMDPFNGIDDLEAKTIRCVGEPQKRFTEDALRILRALRFSSTLDFSIDPSTAEAIHRLADTLSCVSAERIAVEFLKLLCGQNVETILRDYADVFSILFPDVDYRESAKLVSAVPNEPLLRLTALVFDCAPNTAEMLCKRLRLSTRMTKEVTTLLLHRHISLEATRSNILRALHHLGPELTKAMLSIRAMTDAQDFADFQEEWMRLKGENDLCYQLKDLAVTGDDLMASGIRPGRAIGDTLNNLLHAVMDGICANQKEELLKFSKIILLLCPVHLICMSLSIDFIS